MNFSNLFTGSSIIKNLCIYFIFLIVQGFPCCARALSSCVWTFHCGSSSCCRTQALECGLQQLSLQVQRLRHAGLVAPQHMESFWAKDPLHWQGDS